MQGLAGTTQPSCVPFRTQACAHACGLAGLSHPALTIQEKGANSKACAREMDAVDRRWVHELHEGLAGGFLERQFKAVCKDGKNERLDWSLRLGEFFS